ncbi:MAG: fused ferrous iron transport protein A/B [Prevotellaceae bacterium]|jgi:ferrous iron transport protein B|nr:fused ferrous iron transport protein A/B [Prevotellaceae bacterium]
MVRQTKHTLHEMPVPLAALHEGDNAEVMAVNLTEREKMKFAALGITGGTTVRVYKTGNPLLLEVAGTRVAIGAATAKKILVQKRTFHEVDVKNPPAATKKTASLKKNMLLVGNPNVGKSQVFTRLTSVKAVSSNFPGTTVEVKKAQAVFNDVSCTIIDVPGIYRLENDNRAEQEASEIIRAQHYDLILYVLEATRLERSLFLALEILALRKPVIFILNKYETARVYGINIDIAKLSDMLHAPVVETEALTGAGFKKLELEVAQHLRIGAPEAIPDVLPVDSSDGKRWEMIGQIVQHSQSLEHRHPTFIERLADMCTRPLSGVPIAILIMAISFFFVRFFGEGLIDLLTPLYEKHYLPFLAGLFGERAHSWWGLILLGDGSESFGILTDALQIALIDVLSYVLIFYAVFEFLADLGYLPRLAILLDSLLHRLGIHGYGAIPILMGLGCKVPAVMSVRTLESKREKTIALLLIMMIAPCITQTGMIFNLFKGHGAGYLLLVFGTLAATGVAAGMLLNKVMKGNPTEMFMEIPAWQWPRGSLWLPKIWYRTREYLVEAVPMIIAGILLINIAQQTGALTYIAEAMRYPVETLMGLPAESSPVIILGFLRKDVSIALLEPFNLSASQLVSACVFMTMYLPCIATFFVMLKEFGMKTTARIIGLTFTVAFVLACLLRTIVP